MLDNTQAFGSYSVSNIQEAEKFYHQLLGLKTEQQEMEGQKMLNLHFENGTEIMIYEKADHQPATFTVLNFPVQDVATTVRDLKNRGIQFEHYPENDKNEITHGESVDVAWFKDPSGNFLSVVKEIH